jgi:WD40 repeat protein
VKPAFDPKQARLIAARPAPGILFAVALDEARRALYGAGTDGALYALDLSNPRAVAVRRGAVHGNYVSGLALRGDTLVSAGYDRQLVWSDPATGKVISSVSGHDGWVRKLAMTPDGSRLVTVGDDMRAIVWDAGVAGQLAVLRGHDPKVPEGYLSALYALAISPDGRFAATGDRAGFVRVWDLTGYQQVAGFRAADFYTFDAVKRARAIGGVRGLAFSSDGSRLAVSGIGAVTNVDGFVGPCRVELWDWKAGRRLAVGQDKHQAILNHVAFGPAGSWLVAAGGGDGGGALVFWDPAGTATHVARPKGHLQAFVTDSAGTRLYAVGHGGFQVWHLTD